MEGVEALGFAGFTPDGTSMIAVGNMGGSGGGALHWIDAVALEVESSVDGAHEGSPKSLDFSPDNSMLAVGSYDGVVKVWRTDNGALAHEIPVGPEVQGVSFLSDHHLLVLPQGGNLRVFTIDPDELIQIARDSVTRGFTEVECEKYGFDDSCLGSIRREWSVTHPRVFASGERDK